MAVYEFSKSPSGDVYSFISTGRRRIKKILIFQKEDYNYYNVVLQDEIKDKLYGDERLTNNGDIYTVLNTVIEIIYDFLKYNSMAIIHITGSEIRRRVIYQRIIRLRFNSIIGLKVFGRRSEYTEFEPFDGRVNYIAFLIIKL